MLPEPPVWELVGAGEVEVAVTLAEPAGAPLVEEAALEPVEEAAAGVEVRVTPCEYVDPGLACARGT